MAIDPLDGCAHEGGGSLRIDRERPGGGRSGQGGEPTAGGAAGERYAPGLHEGKNAPKPAAVVNTRQAHGRTLVLSTQDLQPGRMVIDRSLRMPGDKGLPAWIGRRIHLDDRQGLGGTRGDWEYDGH